MSKPDFNSESGIRTIKDILFRTVARQSGVPDPVISIALAFSRESVRSAAKRHAHAVNSGAEKLSTLQYYATKPQVSRRDKKVANKALKYIKEWQ